MKKMKMEEYGAEEARSYSKHTAMFSFLYRPILKDFEKLEVRGRLLEVGCGPGILAVKIAQKFEVEITAIDISESMIEVAEENIKKANLEGKIKLEVGDVHDENFVIRLGKFDCVYSTFSLHHWENPVKALNNLYSVLEDGMIYILDARKIWVGFIGVKPYSEAYTIGELKDIIKKTEFRSFEVNKRFPGLVSVVLRK